MQAKIAKHEDLIFKSSQAEVKIESPYITELKHQQKALAGWKKRARTSGENSSRKTVHSLRQKWRMRDTDEKAQHTALKKVHLHKECNSQNFQFFI